MRLRLIILLITLLILTLAIHTPTPFNALAFQASDQVRIGGAQFSPTTIGAINSSSNLTISIATGASVPNGATARVEVTESSNFGGVSYTVSPSRSQIVTLSGVGNSTNVVFRFSTTEGNPHGGNIVNRVTITAATNATVGMPASQCAPDCRRRRGECPVGGDAPGRWADGRVLPRWQTAPLVMIGNCFSFLRRSATC
jgi:hypothetical protein